MRALSHKWLPYEATKKGRQRTAKQENKGQHKGRDVLGHYSGFVIRESRDPNNLGGPPLAVLLSYYCRNLDWNQSALHHGSTWRIYRFFPHHRPGVASPKNTVSQGFLCSSDMSREHLHRFTVVICLADFINDCNVSLSLLFRVSFGYFKHVINHSPGPCRVIKGTLWFKETDFEHSQAKRVLSHTSTDMYMICRDRHGDKYCLCNTI